MHSFFKLLLYKSNYSNQEEIISLLVSTGIRCLRKHLDKEVLSGAYCLLSSTYDYLDNYERRSRYYFVLM